MLPRVVLVRIGYTSSIIWAVMVGVAWFFSSGFDGGAIEGLTPMLPAIIIPALITYRDITADGASVFLQNLGHSRTQLLCYCAGFPTLLTVALLVIR